MALIKTEWLGLATYIEHVTSVTPVAESNIFVFEISDKRFCDMTVDDWKDNFRDTEFYTYNYSLAKLGSLRRGKK